ncbi:hypothetical protein CBFG_04716 [Clostridiales bacterium 1_7_47FAA]|nr:hypothetical protein CBFG_04716 [Clostridiales bacterium 1_7_47FAA]
MKNAFESIKYNPPVLNGMRIPYSIRYSLILPRSFDNMYYECIVAYKSYKINNNYYY